MSAKERIAKLEGLLSRIKQRAEAPRPVSRVLPAANVAAAGSFAPPDLASVPPPSLQVSTVTAPPGTFAGEPPMTAPPPSMETAPPAVSGWSEPPPVTELNALDQEDQDALDQMNDVEVSSEVVEVEIDIDEPGMPAESGAHAVSARGAPAELEEPAPAVELEELEEEHIDASSAPPPANEIEEPAPTSSPRVITSETYEGDSAPRHTPPPESGKQVTAPSGRPEPPARKPTAPPPSEGHTLIGGWREAGMGLPGSPGARARGEEGALPRPAVRVPPPPPPESSSPVTPPPVQVQLASARPARLEASVTRADLPGSADVAAFEGGAATFAVSSFGELLDASLAI